MTDAEERARIVETATRRFLELGISKVTLDEIASELGMSKKTLYKHFPGKDALLKNIIQERIRRNGKRITEILESSAPFERKLHDILAFVGRESSAASRQFLADLRRFSPGLWEEVDEFRRKIIVTNVTRMMEDAKKQGLVRQEVDINLFVLLFLSAVQDIMTPHTLAEQSFSAVQAFQGILRILFEGALTEDSRARIVLPGSSPAAFSTER